MKLRTLCCNKTVLRKDITRFAPLWAIYFIGGLLVMLTTLGGSRPSSAARSLASTIGPFSIINMIYAALCAQLLFGDLFQSRMCNALHAMPLRRESWFVIHVIAGLLFSLVPHIVAMGVMMPMLKEFWFIALYWLLGMTLEFLFFFGLAVFSVFCTGNRVGQAAVYGILNFASVIIYWFVDTIYIPLLHGVVIPESPFIRFCPVMQMCINQSMVRFERVQTDIYYYEKLEYQYKGLGEGWGYLAICAGIGVALLVLAVFLYRRRKLECAGNFVAIKALEPVFQVVFTLCAGCVVAAFGQIFDGGYLVYLVVGLVVGWFVAQMLLRRTVKVFQWKTFLKLAIFGAVMAASLVLTELDPIGVTRWQPKVDQVAMAEVNFGTQINTYSTNYLKMDTPEDIQKLIDAQGVIIQEGEQEDVLRMRTFTIKYTLKDGRQITRTYDMQTESSAWSAMKQLYNSPESIMGYSDWDSYVRNVSVVLEGYSLEELCRMYNQKYGTVLNAGTLKQELVEAIRKDCEAGNITQGIFLVDKPLEVHYVELELNNNWRGLSIYSDAKNTAAWFKTYAKVVAMSSK